VTGYMIEDGLTAALFATREASVKELLAKAS
jgi:hypothetical protein